VWHPQQKLWNWRLVSAVTRLLGDNRLARWAAIAIIEADSVLLLARVLLRRLVGGNLGGRGRRNRVLYLDCGVHKRGEQIRWMYRWFGASCELEVLAFEASEEHLRDATAALSDLVGVKLRHVALVGPSHEGDDVRLYKSGGEGKGDSLFAAGGANFEVVPAQRLSHILMDEGYDLSTTPVILRMNIEAAEQLVIEDLIEAGLRTSIDGYFGMWDDLSKVDRAADRRFRRLLRDEGITSVTFNDRDLPFALRRLAIRIDIETAIRAGLARVAAHGSENVT
jgi:hypothetical protein